MTDAEREKLAAIAKHIDYHMQHEPESRDFLLALARRADAAEHRLSIYLRDCGADGTAQGDRDALLIDGVRRQAEADVAQECIDQARRLPFADGDDRTDWIEQAIRERFALDGGPTLTERVRQETAECAAVVVEATNADSLDGYRACRRAAAAIRERFGLH